MSTIMKTRTMWTNWNITKYRFFWSLIPLIAVIFVLEQRPYRPFFSQITQMLHRFRSKPTRRRSIRQNNKDSHSGLPPILRRRISCPPRSPRYRTWRWHGFQHGGAPGAGRVSTRRPNEEDQSWLAGKSFQTEERSACRKIEKDYC